MMDTTNQPSVRVEGVADVGQVRAAVRLNGRQRAEMVGREQSEQSISGHEPTVADGSAADRRGTAL